MKTYLLIRMSLTMRIGMILSVLLLIMAGKENVYSAEEVKKVLIDERNNFSKCQEISSTDVFLFK
ncbi:MAG: hypothetical protein SOW21_06610 [[Actinobacillus] rossii]|nr:hypothetical protein [[Actinobacillus] rossii]